MAESSHGHLQGYAFTVPTKLTSMRVSDIGSSAYQQIRQ
jgi:hypothetical protein